MPYRDNQARWIVGFQVRSESEGLAMKEVLRRYFAEEGSHFYPSRISLADSLVIRMAFEKPGEK